MSVKETTGVNMVAKIFLVATGVVARKDTFNITNGINVLVRVLCKQKIPEFKFYMTEK